MTAATLAISRYRVPARLLLVGLSLLGALATPAQERLTIEQLVSRLPAEIAVEIQRRASAASGVPVPDDASRQAVLDEFRAGNAKPVPRPATGTGRVGAAARCATGYIVNSSYSVSAADVVIVSQRRFDCDARGCRSFQVNADRTRSEPYELDVSVTCTG